MNSPAFFQNRHASVAMTAGANDVDGHNKITFVCNKGVNFISNDSPDTILYINFDSPVGQAGTITLLPGETINDLALVCRELYAKGNGKPVPFRALGV